MSRTCIQHRSCTDRSRTALLKLHHCATSVCALRLDRDEEEQHHSAAVHSASVPMMRVTQRAVP